MRRISPSDTSRVLTEAADRQDDGSAVFKVLDALARPGVPNGVSPIELGIALYDDRLSWLTASVSPDQASRMALDMIVPPFD